MNQTEIVRSKYPDAYCKKYAALSMVIWSNVLNRRLSGFFHTEKEAWDDAVEWINPSIIELSPKEGLRLLFVPVEKEATDFIVMGFPGSVELTKGIERYDLYANGINNTPYRHLYQKKKPIILGIATELSEEVARELVEKRFDQYANYGDTSFFVTFQTPNESWASFLRLHGIGERELVLRANK